ncbi:MAG TPA: response regulator [Blastocatellia bacterium]
MGKKILVVEDNKDTRELFVCLLELNGFQVSQAIDGRSGLETARVEKPDLILTDINMPNMNGIDMIRILRSDPAFSDLPILAVTAYGFDFGSEAVAAGASAQLRKPVEFEQLTAKIQELLDK